jgi:hypothetical protein
VVDYTRRLFSKPLNFAKPFPTINNVDDFELRHDKLGMPHRKYQHDSLCIVGKPEVNRAAPASGWIVSLERILLHALNMGANSRETIHAQ